MGVLDSDEDLTDEQRVELITVELMCELGRGYGLDLLDDADLIPAAALGLMTTLWRNTPLENVHARGDMNYFRDLCKEKQLSEDEVWREHSTALDVHHAYLEQRLNELQGVEDPSEEARICKVVDGVLCAFGIPDDVMMRVNCFTAHELIPILTEMRGGHPRTHTGIPEWLWVAFDHLGDPERSLRIGGVDVRAWDLFWDANWQHFSKELHQKMESLLGLYGVVGEDQLIRWLALSGASFASGYYPLPEWRAGLEAAPVRVLSGDADYREALCNAPWLLNGAQAKAAIHNQEIKQAVTQERVRRQKLIHREGDFRTFDFRDVIL